MNNPLARNRIVSRGCTSATRRCPLWVISRHFTEFDGCLLYPRKRTSGLSGDMSALGQERTLHDSLDHLIGNQLKITSKGKPQGFRCIQIDDQLEFGRLLHRQFGGLGALKNFIDVWG